MRAFQLINVLINYRYDLAVALDRDGDGAIDYNELLEYLDGGGGGGKTVEKSPGMICFSFLRQDSQPKQKRKCS